MGTTRSVVSSTLFACVGMVALLSSGGCNSGDKSAEVTPDAKSSAADASAVSAQINAVKSNPNIPPQYRAAALKNLEGPKAAH